MNILTFDIEDWFHINFSKDFNDEMIWKSYSSRIEYNTNIILDLLEEAGIQGTFFCLGWVARVYPGLIRRIHERGHDVGNHSDMHNLASLQSMKEFKEDLGKSIKSLEDATGNKIRIYRAPAFSIGRQNLWAIEVLIENGIEADCSVFPARHDFGGFPDAKFNRPFSIKQGEALIREFPMSTYNLLGFQAVLTGGGYFRLYPYGLIKKYIRSSNYNMTYFHPRDFDAEQPVLEGLGIKRRIKSYYGLNKSLNKFQKLIRDFKFTSVSAAMKQYDWAKLEVINLDSI